MMTRCEFCRHGMPAHDGKVWYRVCTLIPPQPTPVTSFDERGIPILVTKWERPAMALRGWCGQFKFSLARLLFRDGA